MINEITDEFDDDVILPFGSAYDMHIDFDENFIKYMNEKYPVKTFEETSYDVYDNLY